MATEDAASDKAQADGGQSEAKRRVPAGRPKDAASLIVVRRQAGGIRLLTGRRSGRHVFMPGMRVFPGGRVEPADYRAKTHDRLDAGVERRLLSRLAGRRSPARADAIAKAGLRETAEEAGILIGASGTAAPASGSGGWSLYRDQGLVPSLSPLRLVARAITPPGMVRRFDARFFAVAEDSVVARIEPVNDELTDLEWLDPDGAEQVPMAPITRVIFRLLVDRLGRDPDLTADESVPFYYSRGARMCCEWI